MHGSSFSRGLLLLGSLVGLVCGASCGLERSPEPPRGVLLVTLDTTRADVLNGGPAAGELAPRITALGADGVRFERAYTVAPLTLPAHVSLLTGLVPPRHGVSANGRTALSEEAKTLAELLHARGFQTAAFVSALVLDRAFGLDQGFDLYDQPQSPERRAMDTARAAADWIARRHGEPYFLWVHLYDAHSPYEPAPEHLERAHGDPYRGEIAALDDAVGVLLDALEGAGLEEQTLVAVTADHGESFGEHGEWLHGSLCYEPTLRVPLLFHFPDGTPEPGPVRIASAVDLLPTLLGRLALPVPAGLDGIDLCDQEHTPERGVYFEALTGWLDYGWSPLVGWLDARGKYLHSSKPEFYAVARDPGEHTDLVESRHRECELARAELARVFALPALEPRTAASDAELDEALTALGYARGGGGAPTPVSPLEPSDRPDPRSRAVELGPLVRASTLFDQERYAESRLLLAEIVRENPHNLVAVDHLTLCLMYAHEFERAEVLLRQRLEDDEVADARLNLGLCLIELGRLEEAERQIVRAAQLLPGEPSIEAALGRVRARLGR